MNKWKTYWIVPGVLSVLCLWACRWVGYFAISNLIALGLGIYVTTMAKKREKRFEENADVIAGMNRKQKKALLVLDEKQVKNIASLNLLAAVLNGGCLILNLYTYFYNQGIDKVTGAAGLSASWSLALLGGGLLLGAAGAFLCFINVKQILSKD